MIDYDTGIRTVGWILSRDTAIPFVKLSSSKIESFVSFTSVLAILSRTLVILMSQFCVYGDYHDWGFSIDIGIAFLSST